MKKRIVSVFLAVLLLFCLFSTSVLADSGSSGGNWYDWIVNIFVPADNYFNNKIAELNDKVNKKMGGVAYLFRFINDFFKTIQNPPPDKDIAVTVPDNFLFKGYKGTSASLFTSNSAPFIRIVKFVTTSFLLVITGIACYKKLIKLFEQ